MKYNMVKLKELCTVNQGLQIPISKRFKEPGKNRHFYITVQFLKESGENYYIETPPISVTCTENEILVVRTGNTGQVITGVAGCFHNNFFKVSPNKKVYSKYLYYALNNKEMRNAMLNAASGTIISDLKHSSFYKLEIPLPKKEIQIKIAKILDDICAKLKLNTNINNNLQELAKNIYYDKFNNKTTNGKLKDILELNKKGIKNKNENLKYFPVDVLPMNYLITKDGKSNEEAQSSLVEFKKYDILIGAMRVYFHRVCLAAEDGLTRTTTFVLRPKDKDYLYYSLITLDKDEFIKYANDSSRGSTMPYAVWNGNCEDYKIYIPTKEEAKEFNDIVKPLFEMQINLEENNRYLERLRDTLLPKLMNGEIDLDNIEI